LEKQKLLKRIQKAKMDKIIKNAQTTVSFGQHSIHRIIRDVTELEALNDLCRDAAKQNRVIIKATIKMVDGTAIYSGRNNFDNCKDL